MILYSLLFSVLVSCSNAVQDEQSIAFDHYVVMAATDDNVTEVDYLYKHFKFISNCNNMEKFSLLYNYKKYSNI